MSGNSIPDGWSQASLASVGTVVTGSTPPTGDRSNYGLDFMFASPADLGESKYVTATEKMLSKRGFARSRRIPKGSTLFVCIGSTIGKVGVAAADLTTNQQINSIIPGKRVDPEYLFYAATTLSSPVREQAGEQAVPLVNKSQFSAFEILLPPIGEQRAIARSLGDADDLVGSLERLIAKKQAIKQGMMQQLLTGTTRLPGFTAPWTEATFEHLASPSRERAMPQSVAATTPLVDLDQIEGSSGRLIGTSQASAAVSLKSVFKPGDVLFGKLRAYLRKFWYADFGGLCTTEIWVLRARAGVHGLFVRYIVETDRFIDVASGAYGTHMPRSDWGTVRALPVMVPPHDEQVAIASALGDIDTEIGLLHQRLLKARDVKQGMMQQLLTGRTRLSVAESSA